MPDAAAHPRSARIAPAHGVAWVWAGFVAVHAANILLNLFHISRPLSDVTVVYRSWVNGMVNGAGVPGVDRPFVYPLASLAPMLLARLVGGDSALGMGLAWLALVSVLDALALWALLRVGRRAEAGAWPAGVRAGAWWVAYCAAAGPITMGRIDAITVPLALLGIVALRRHPGLAGALWTLGAWMKVWPAALVFAALVASRRRLRIAGGAAAVCAGVVVGAWALGGVGELLSFLGMQQGRGLQLESTAASAFLLANQLGIGHVTTGFDFDILTYQVYGPGVAAVTRLLTPLLALLTLAVVGLEALAARRRPDDPMVLPAAALALVCVFFVANRVGSAQFVCWLGPAIVLGLLAGPAVARRFRVPAVLALVLAALTQAIYPHYYYIVFAQSPIGVVLLVVRNALWVALLAWAVRELVRVVRSSPLTRTRASDPARRSAPSPRHSSVPRHRVRLADHPAPATPRRAWAGAP